MTQVNSGDPDSESDASPMPGHAESTGERSKKLENVSERERKRSRPKEEDSSPDRPREEPDDPGGEAAIPGCVHSIQEGPRKVENERVVETNVHRRGRGPRGHLGKPEALGDVEGDPDHARVVEGAGYDGIGPSSNRNERVDDTKVLRPDRRPGGHLGEPESSRVVEGDWRRRTGVDGVGYHGIWCSKDSATSDARRESKRLETRSLAGDESSQQELEKRSKHDVPEPSQLPSIHPRRPTESVDPPRRRGRLKSPTKRIRRSKIRRSTYQVVQPHRTGRMRRTRRTRIRDDEGAIPRPETQRRRY